MEVVVERCAGLDIGKREVQASIRVPDGEGGRRMETRTYSTYTSSVESMAQWLAGEGVTDVVMESTGPYWKPIWYVLEEGPCRRVPAHPKDPGGCRHQAGFGRHRHPGGVGNRHAEGPRGGRARSRGAGRVGADEDAGQDP